MRLPVEMQGCVRTRFQAWRFVILLDNLMVRNMIWRTLCMSGGLQAGVPKGLPAVTTLRVTVDAMPSGLRVGRKLPACVWLAFIIFSKPSGRQRIVRHI